MEWRIVVAVLCLTGIVTVPGISANSTNATTNSSTVFEFNVTFHVNETFNEAYLNMTNNATITLKNRLSPEVTRAFSTLKNFQGFDILQFRNGSVVVDGKLYFNSSDSKPTVANLTQIFQTTNFSFTIIQNLTRITEVMPTAEAPTTAPATTANQTTNSNQTTTTAAATVPTPANLATINVVFRILQDYKPVYANLSDPETIKLIENITNAFIPFYKRRFPKSFHGMKIRKLSQGSVIADANFEFDNTNNTSPNVTEVRTAFTEAVASGNLSFSVDASSINATDITNVTATTQAATTVSTTTVSSALAEYNATFRINETFSSDLTNISSSLAVALAKKISDQFDIVFKRRFSNFVRTLIWRFRSGSVIVDAQLGFNKNGTNPTAAEVVDVIRNGTFTFTVQSVSVTDPSGTTANRSPVLASMLTALWMTLMSLLVSAVMH